jgi:hypothetical protein
LILAGAQAEGVAIPEVVAIETATVETVATEPVIEATAATTPELGTTVAPESNVEAWVDPHPEASTNIVIRRGGDRRRCTTLLDAHARDRIFKPQRSRVAGGHLVYPIVVSLRMEPWRRTEQ